MRCVTPWLQGYFGEDFEEGIVRDNFTLVYELLDEILDFGYPQTSSLEVLKMYINLGSQKKLKNINTHGDLSSMITGALDWRREGIRYRNNQVGCLPAQSPPRPTYAVCLCVFPTSVSRPHRCSSTCWRV